MPAPTQNGFGEEYDVVIVGAGMNITGAHLLVSNIWLILPQAGMASSRPTHT
jgi:hypothetical protein